MNTQPNILFILADQLRANSLPVYGEKQIHTPHIDRLAQEGTLFSNAISTCPLCTPYRSMLLTGRYPQETGHILNFMRTRHDEISIADAFNRAGYQTAWIGKWHLHTGSFPQFDGPDYVPEGRDRLGFQHWRGYNYHTTYFDGPIALVNWHYERWKGYETEALNRYLFSFLDNNKKKPFCAFISPHQPHPTFTPKGAPEYAPKHFYDKIPEKLLLPDNVPEELRAHSIEMYRHYLAMILALDEMVGDIMTYLDKNGLTKNTIIVFTSDHGTQVGAQGYQSWRKRVPYEDSVKVPLIVKWPGNTVPQTENNSLVSPVDLFPTLCGLCNVKIPRTVSGKDLSESWLDQDEGYKHDAVLTMNFTNFLGQNKPQNPDHLITGSEWRGVRTHKYSYVKWLNGHVELYNLANDPRQETNLAENTNFSQIRQKLENRLQELMHEINDELEPCTNYENWFDYNRRIIRNINGPLGNPEQKPDWSMLEE